MDFSNFNLIVICSRQRLRTAQKDIDNKLARADEISPTPSTRQGSERRFRIKLPTQAQLETVLDILSHLVKFIYLFKGKAKNVSM